MTVSFKESMIDHLAGQAALEIEHYGQAEDATQRQPDQRAFVKMRVDDIKAAGGQEPQCFQAKQHVKNNLVAARPHLPIPSPGDRHRAPDLQTWSVSATVVGRDGDNVTKVLKGPRFLQDAHMASVVREETRRGYHQDTVDPLRPKHLPGRRWGAPVPQSPTHAIPPSQ